MYKKVNVVMLPTNEKAVRKGQLVIGAGNHLFASRQSNDIGSLTAYELYITSDEEIKIGDWFLEGLLEPTNIRQINTKDLLEDLYDNEKKRKIIATTDKSIALYTYIDFPEPSQQFIQQYIGEYNKSNVITKVDVEYESMDISTMTSDIKTYPNLSIDTLKVNPDNIINIKPIKDSWNREEVEVLLWNLANDIDSKYRKYTTSNNEGIYFIDKFIKNNL